MSSLAGPYVRSALDLIEKRGASTTRLLDGIPIELAALEQPRTRVSYAVCEAILSRAVHLTRDPLLAAAVGMHLRATSHGFLGFAAMTARTVRDALELSVRFSQTVRLSLHISGETASIVLAESKQLPTTLRPFVVIAFFVELVRLGRSWTESTFDCTIECGFPANGYPRRLPLLDRAQFVFDAPAHRIVFPSFVLDLPLSHADPAASHLARTQCERELNEVGGGSLSAQVTELLSVANGASSLDDVAMELGLSARTLKRRLAELGASFSHIREEVRRQRSLLLLANRELSIGEIARTLGYTELTNFTRAFRRWTGSTPNAYRLVRNSREHEA